MWHSSHSGTSTCTRQRPLILCLGMSEYVAANREGGYPPLRDVYEHSNQLHDPQFIACRNCPALKM
jgi:hypothetical protein